MLSSINLLILLQYTFVGNGHLALETLFSLSGLLVGYSYSRQLQRQAGKVSWLRHLAHRYWRTVPVMAVVGLSYLGSFPYLAQGKHTQPQLPLERKLKCQVGPTGHGGSNYTVQ